MPNVINKREVLICRGTGCNSSNSDKLTEKLKLLIKDNGLSEFVTVKITGCHGFCQVGPIMAILPENVLYVRVQEDDLDELVEKHLINNNIIEKLLYKDPKTGKPVKYRKDIQFYYEQNPIILKNIGKINPESIDDYIDVGGYKSLEKVLKKFTPIEVINEIKKSRLRGRGGAGFPTGQKWEFCRNASDFPKYIICNGDEGDPGAYMDRSILESDPHSVIEGMIIAAYAIGSNYGYIYTRAEYPLAIERFKIALTQAKQRGYLGNNIFNSDFNFDIELKKGAGAFVCGEETALIASIMGKRGMPRPRPPFPAESGLWDKPTNINNVKTYASIPRIFEKGADWYSSIGTDDASGTIVIALTGKINNSGLVEIPMGTTLRKVIFDIGGGIPEGKKFKAIQIGGPSGGCLPDQFLDTQMDYYNLTNLGAIMGSGGVIVLDESTCMVDLAHFFISFTQKESCGKCAPCRVGTKKMLDILNSIREGNGCLDDLDELERIANIVKKTSLCGLGQTAPNPVLTTLKYFKAEYEAHIFHQSCPALVCKNLIEYSISDQLCKGCGLCKKNCPSNAIEGELKAAHLIDPKKCIKCGLCYSSCSSNAIFKKTNEIKMESKNVARQKEFIKN
ncbi:MAG: NADH-quinone oxidoreductase subunit NuoF [Candidatus Lokiarchaeota archaeon]|nr:NADH-quinone oxidoreductase subunit NuoF [Candidatus Lokiarchaeota archaeon]